MSTTKVDIIVIGATGFTGQKIVKYLSKHPQRSLFTLAIAGRSTSKLEELANSLDGDDGVGIITFDMTDEKETEEVVKRAKVVINCVGPFWKWSTPVVRACALNGIHYVDITGEPWWVRDIIEQYDYQAMKSKAIIIPCTGIDSIPSDLAVYLSARHLSKRHGLDLSLGKSVTVINMDTVLSGGSLGTILSAFDLPRGKLETIGSNPYSLSAIKGIHKPFHFWQKLPDSSAYGGIALMGEANEKIVNRTWGLFESRAFSNVHEFALERKDEDRGFAYGQHFVYEEYAQSNNPITATAWTVGFLVGMVAIMVLPPLRWVLKVIGPKSGSGWGDRHGQTMKWTNVTVLENEKESAKTELVFQGGAYTASAYMAAESALAILLNRKELPAMANDGGILTPVTGLGDVLVRRLKESGRVEMKTKTV